MYNMFYILLLKEKAIKKGQVQKNKAEFVIYKNEKE